MGNLSCSILWSHFLIEKLFPLDMKGKAILITGCDTGFGHDFAIRCVQNGMIVFAGCHLPETLRTLQEKA
uniref:Uncharacterized protein n=1 Tax=Ditylenchus dipsaci TaxID=166011 RepID=A0A915EPW8_9BILA